MKRQRGAALLLSVLLVAIGAGLFVVNIARDTTRIVQSEQRLASGLNDAAEALLAHAVAHPTRPGAFPCPDTNDDGIAESLVSGACPAYIGRLPWRTLGLGDVRDETAERYWYALSPNFRDSVPINSDTKGNRVVRSGSAAVTLTSEAVAIIFAPGNAVGNQLRNSALAACAATGTSIARNLCADNYLETAATVNNASATGPYIAAAETPLFNDRLVVLRTPDFIPLVERRVASELRQTLVNYRATSKNVITGGGCSCYPWADSSNDGSSNTGSNRGRVPLTASPHNWGASLKDPATNIVYTLPTLPAYFQTNNWSTVIYYAVGRNALQNAGLSPTACTTCTVDPVTPPPPKLFGTLSVDGTNGHALALITPGSAAANRPSASWTDYIDDAANRDNDDRFVTPASKLFDRDRLATVADDIPPASCNPNAKMLIFNAPCHTTGNNVKAVCSNATSNLQVCTQCASVANVMITPPCRNSLNPQVCQDAIATLQACKA